MLNQVMLVGRLVDNPIIEENEGKKTCNLTLAVPRSYKNADGIYETDFVDCVLWTGIAEQTTEYCHKGDLVGIRGRIETKNFEGRKITQIIAEKVTFLSTKKAEE